MTHPAPNARGLSRRGLVLAFALALAAHIAGLSAATAAPASHATENATQSPAPLDRARRIGGAFSLINQDGKPVTDASFRGAYMLVYFGYTYCPDLCPTGLQSIGQALDTLGADAGKVKGVFITVDPERDTPAKLKAYVSNFHAGIEGLTGTPAQIASVARKYQASYAKGDIVDGQDYEMDHTSRIYLMGPKGEFIAAFDENADPAALVAAVRRRLGRQ